MFGFHHFHPMGRRGCGFGHPHHRAHPFHAMGRHSHRPGGFGFDPRGWGDSGDFGGGRGRKLSSGDLQLLILALLAEQPRHGYELIKALDERSGGFYVPSPGVIYPALSYLEEIGHAAVEQEGTKKRYSLTDAGRQHLEANRTVVDMLLQQLQRVNERAARMREALQGDDWMAGGPSRHEPQRHALHAAMHELRAALREGLGRGEADEAELQRVLAILRQAADAIRQR